jgi:hypothetical protein
MNMMNSQGEQLIELLRRCTVKLLVPGGHGTGFFVAPGTILSCAHVVKPAQEAKKPVTAYWNGQSYTASIQRYLAEMHPDLQMLYPDLALLKVDNLTGHPCVYLHEEAHLGDKFYSYGYIEDYKGGDSSTFENEGWTDERKLLLKLKAGQAQSGLSGAPVLNRRTGGVCGMMKRSRGTDSDLGGRAIPVSRVFQELPELVEQQRQFHQRDRRWYDCLAQEQREKLEMVTSTSKSQSTGAVEVFFSYHPKDSNLRDELAKHLKPMKREGLITDWYAGNTEAGVEEKEEAKTYLDTARIILMIVSPDFLASDYHYDVEMKRALERHKAGEVRVIPIMLKPTEGWDRTDFKGLLSLPRDGRPVSKWPDKDEAFANIAGEIRRVANHLQKPNP